MPPAGAVIHVDLQSLSWSTGDPIYTPAPDLSAHYLDVTEGNLIPGGTPPLDYVANPPTDGDPVKLGGDAVLMDSAWRALSAYDDSQPCGPVTVMFVAGGAPMQCSTVRVLSDGGTFYDDTYWTTPTTVTYILQGVTATPLDADGADLAAGQTLYDLDLTGYGDDAALAADCYGVRFDHINPGYDNPAGWLASDLYLTIGANPTPGGRRPHLRQRQRWT